MNRDQKFFDLYSLVIGILALFALAIFVLAIRMSGMTQGQYTSQDPEYRAAVAERLKPYGEVFLPGQELEAPGPQAPAVAEPEPVAAMLSGPQVYNQACIICHGAGVGGAPVLDDASVWTTRLDQGIDVLRQHAVEGYQGEVGYMPAKGGNMSLADEEVWAAVDFMVSEVQGN